ncbi:MAG: PxKF domain-containing protein [Actinomycetota bacterium]|nr:PxKF domain-containing protein [Actinomycetota bacterium]
MVINNVVNDTNGNKVVTIDAGDSATVTFYIQVEGNDGNGGCNASDGTSATLSMNAPAGVTASPTSLMFTRCNTAGTQSVSFSSNTAGTYSIAPTVSDSGTGSYNTSGGAFTFQVNSTDTTTPSISYALNPATADGSNGWYKSNVTLDWTVSDPESTVTTTGCVDRTIDADQAATTYSCSASSAGGESGPVTVSIKRDATAPTIIATAKTADESTYTSGTWTNQDVTVSYTCSDATSGLAGACPSPQTFSTTTVGQSVSNSVADFAGNLGISNVIEINIDKSGPGISNTFTPAAPDGSNGWYRTNVLLDWTVTEADSPSTLTTDGCLDTNVVSDQAETSYSCSATSAGGTSGPVSVSIKRDATAPTITSSGSTVGGPYTSGTWTYRDVTVQFSCSDATSGIAANACPASQTFTSNTLATGQSVSDSVSDLAGNVASSNTVVVKIDKDAPTISASATKSDGTAYASGTWTNLPVTVTYVCDDALSGLDAAGCPAAQTISSNTSTDGNNVSGAVFDLAGNGATSNIINVKIDQDRPNITASAATPDGTYTGGWTNQTVTVSYACSDALSGIAPGACPSDEIVSSSTPLAGRDISDSVVDRAGNSQTSNVINVKVDKEAPTITATATTTDGAYSSGSWTNKTVTVTYSCSDDLSGVGALGCPAGDVISSETTSSGQSVSATVYDAAGNSAASDPITVKVDKTAPTVAYTSASPTPNAAGWYNTDVVATFTATDTLSGFAGGSTKTGTSTTSGEGSPVTVGSPSFTDLAGNIAAAGTATSNPFKIDKTDPRDITFVGGPGEGGRYYFGSVPAAPTCTAEDDISGVKSCIVTGYGTSLGDHTLTATATDIADNVATARRSYTVLAWTISGFYSPVDMGGVVNTVKNGSTVPLKFEVFAGTTELTDTSIVSLSAKRITCSSSAPEDAIEVVATGSTSLRYDGGQFIYNWKTPSAANTCYAVTMTTQDGSSITAFFKLK